MGLLVATNCAKNTFLYQNLTVHVLTWALCLYTFRPWWLCSSTSSDYKRFYAHELVWIPAVLYIHIRWADESIHRDISLGAGRVSQKCSRYWALVWTATQSSHVRLVLAKRERYWRLEWHAVGHRRTKWYFDGHVCRRSLRYDLEKCALLYFVDAHLLHKAYIFPSKTFWAPLDVYIF